MKHFAPLIRAALVSLDGQLQAQLNAFNAEDGNPELKLPPVLQEEERHLSGVASGRALYFGGRETHYAFPAIEIAVTDGELFDFAMNQVAGSLDASVVVVVWVQDKDVAMPVLYEMALGYARCIQDVLLQPRAFGDSAKVNRVRFAYTAPDPETRRFEHTTIAGLQFYSLEDVERRST